MLLGIDYGQNKLGIAFGYEEMKIATPHDVFISKNVDEQISYIKKLVEEHDVTKVIIGVPYNLSGKENQQSEIVKCFVQLVKEQLKVEVITVDERLTTRQAKELFKGKVKSKNMDDDSIAAMLILQNYLDAL